MTHPVCRNSVLFLAVFFNVSIASGSFFGMFLTNFEKKHRNSVLFSLLFSEKPQILKISRYLGASDRTAVHCALCTVQNKVFSVLYAFFSVQCAVCNRQCVVWNVKCAECAISYPSPQTCSSSQTDWPCLWGPACSWPCPWGPACSWPCPWGPACSWPCPWGPACSWPCPRGPACSWPCQSCSPCTGQGQGEGLASLFLGPLTVFLGHCLSNSISHHFFKTCIVFLKFNYFLDTTCITCTITSDLHFFNAIHFQNYGRNSACRII